jgi:hypothetical protein
MASAVVRWPMVVAHGGFGGSVAADGVVWRIGWWSGG